MVTFSEAVKICLTKKFATISGRASRAEYWWFQLFIWSTTFLLILIGAALEKKGGNIHLAIACIFFFIMIIPNFCSRVRRLHDTNHSGWNLLWGCIPYLGSIGAIYILILECTGSDSGLNDYGPNPYEINELEFSSKERDEETIIEQDETTEVTDIEL